MKIEVRCPACQKGYLVEEQTLVGGELFCPGCSSRIDVLASVPQEPEPVVEGTGPGIGDEVAEVVCPRCKLHFAPRNAATRPRLASEARPTVLVVEDMSYFQQIAVDALSELYEVRTASTVAEAHEQLIHGDIDVLLLDLTLDGGDHGFDLLRSFAVKPCPILIFTAKDESEMYGDSWEELQELGADDIVMKSMNVDEVLLRKVDAVLGRDPEQENLVSNTVISRE
ncbi:MAG: response regulator [bacterium]|nr:response regulator [bacterium]